MVRSSAAVMIGTAYFTRDDACHRPLYYTVVRYACVGPQDGHNYTGSIGVPSSPLPLRHDKNVAAQERERKNKINTNK